MGNMASDTATIAFAFDNTATGTRTWDIKVGQIPCFGDFVYFEYFVIEILG